MRLHLTFRPLLRGLALSFLLASVIPSASPALQAPQKQSEKPAAKPSSTPEKAENPYQIELLETRYRFEANGDSRKEVHTRVHINNELGVRQFARINFDYNRSFQSIEITLVHITHPGGGTADILPSAITDNPNPAVVNAPAYQDVRVKSVRILGLAPGDILEYRIITTTTHHPLAPEFWLDHSFDRSGIVSHEIFDLDFPASRQVQIRINALTPATSNEKSGESDAARTTYRWERSSPLAGSRSHAVDNESTNVEPDVVLTTFATWNDFSDRLASVLHHPKNLNASIDTRAETSTKQLQTGQNPLEALYDFVSKRIKTIDLPLGAAGFRTRSPGEVLDSGYATAEDKYVLLASLSKSDYIRAALVDSAAFPQTGGLPRPTTFNRLLAVAFPGHWTGVWMDLNLEVAPFAMISPQFRGKRALLLESANELWTTVGTDLPFVASQTVGVEAELDRDGRLTAKVHYSLRGDNELLLRTAFHQSPKEKWKDLAQLLSLSDGFRGQVTNVTASDAYATKEPFTVGYEITQPKFVDWSKKPIRIPALLPQLGLPDLPAKPAPGAAVSPIELGTPLEVETHMTLHLPPGTTVSAPTGTSVQRDYATFVSQYSAKGQTVSASRQINFLQRQVPADRAADYNAFLRAVQNDQAQGFTLDRASPPEPAAKPASSTGTPPPTRKP